MNVSEAMRREMEAIEADLRERGEDAASVRTASPIDMAWINGQSDGLVTSADILREAINRTWPEVKQASESAGRELTAKGYLGASLTASDLVERAVQNAGRQGDRPRPRWAWVKDIFETGCTSSSELCRVCGLYPDEQVGENDGESAPEGTE